MTEDAPSTGRPAPRIGLFHTCLVDLFRPSVGFAAVKLLEDAGCHVEVPENQTCCGQPAYNAGDRADASAIAKQVIAEFEPYDYVVVPSGSCGAQIKKDYIALLDHDPEWGLRAKHLSERTYELTQFLVDVLGITTTDATFDGTVTYHDSCSNLRSMKVREQPRALLAGCKGLSLEELQNPQVCCGFGGTFCVKYADVSNAMVEDKTKDIVSTGADTVLAGDLGCLLNISGKLKRQGSTVKVRHVAEVLAGMTDQPPIGDPVSR